MPLLQVHDIRAPQRTMASATRVAQLLSEVKISSASMNSRQPSFDMTLTSSAQRSGDFLRYPSPMVILEAQKSHLNTQPRENSAIVAGRFFTMRRDALSRYSAGL